FDRPAARNRPRLRRVAGHRDSSGGAYWIRFAFGGRHSGVGGRSARNGIVVGRIGSGRRAMRAEFQMPALSDEGMQGHVKTALLILVHGSPHESANEEMFRV